MNKQKINKIIGDGNIVIPLYILKYFKKLNLTMEEFMFLMYLYNKQNNLDFNPDTIAKDLNIDIMEVMGYIAVLTDKGYLTLEVRNSDANVLEEVINLDNFYEKISTLVINNSKAEDDDNDILPFIEKELGRTLNSIEIETINGWVANKINKDLIKEAIKIALDEGVYSLKYVDRILIDFKARGISSPLDLEKDKKNLSETQNEDNSYLEASLEGWDWLDDEEEYIEN